MLKSVINYRETETAILWTGRQSAINDVSSHRRSKQDGKVFSSNPDGARPFRESRGRLLFFPFSKSSFRQPAKWAGDPAGALSLRVKGNMRRTILDDVWNGNGTLRVGQVSTICFINSTIISPRCQLFHLLRKKSKMASSVSRTDERGIRTKFIK